MSDLDDMAHEVLRSMPAETIKRFQAARLCTAAIRADKDGNSEEALRLFQKAVVTCPGYGAAWADMGICLFNLERYSESCAALEKASQSMPDDFSVWAQLAWANAKFSSSKFALKEQVDLP